MSRPGSALWLLRHELRLMWAGALSAPSGGARRMDRKTVATWTIMVLALHAGAFALVDLIPAPGMAPSAQARAGIGAVLSIGVLFMMATAMKASSESLFERGDFDLLLSSPVSTRSIMTVRMAMIVGRVASIYLFFLAPLAHAGLILGRPRLLALYPVTLALSALAAAAAMLLTLTLVRWFGVRVARVVAQVIGPLFGAALFIGAQLTSTSLREPLLQAYAWLGSWLGPESAAGVATDALLGEPAALAYMLMAAACALIASSVVLHAYFARGVQLTAGSARAVRAPAGELRLQFRPGVMRAVMIKEWKSIARDSQLISQVLLQTLYLVPLAAALFAETGPSLATTTAAMVFLCASLTSALTWIVVSAEEAPDLLASSPADAALVVRAKLAAVLVPALSLAAVPAAWVAVQHWLQGALMFLAIGLASSSAASVAFWFGRPAPRGEFRKRARGNALSGGFDLLITGCWATCAYLLLNNLDQAVWGRPRLLGAAGAMLCALLLLGVARLWRAGGTRAL